MDHIYRDRVPADEADKVIQEKKKELRFNPEYMNILNYRDFNNADLKNVSIIEYKGLERVYPAVKVPRKDLERVVNDLKFLEKSLVGTQYEYQLGPLAELLEKYLFPSLFWLSLIKPPPQLPCCGV